MTESIRTLIFVGVAALVGLVAFFVRPRAVMEKPGAQVGQVLFEKFTNAQDAKSLEITTFDDKTADFRTFEVAQKNGRWVIPSHADYPADGAKQLTDAATGLLNLEALGIASESASDHVLYGVVEPSPEKLKVGDQGVGTLVDIKDAKGNDLLRLIIGKAVQGAEGQHFVRKPGQEPVYVCNVDLTKLPVDFDKWIEKDLLQLNPLDIAKVTIKDYSIIPDTSGMYFSPRMDAIVDWNGEAGTWSLEKLDLYDEKSKPHPAGLGEQEVLNDQTLNDMKTALDDLKIADVTRKPKGLGADLKVSSEFGKNEENIRSLARIGFMPVSRAGNKLDIVSSNGEVQVEMKDGVQYILRFGNVEGAQEGSDEGKLNRYLFVTAQVAPDTLKLPMLEEEPAGPDQPQPTKPAKDDVSQSGGCDDEPAAEDKAKPAADAKAADAKPAADAKAADTKPVAEDKEPVPPAKATKSKPAKPAAAPDPGQLERDRIRTANQRKMDDYHEKLKKAQAHVDELNARFADWYYVISEDVYKKVHLTRSDIIKESADAKDEGFGPDAFRKLEDEGIELPLPKPSGNAPAPFGGFQN
jgi:hypothetical protein